MLIRNTWILGSNVTTIEGWEIERHETLFRRANARGGYLDGPDGKPVRIPKQEFPYDIGIYQNARQAMGTTFLLWLWPLAPTPSNATGLDFETNGFEGTLIFDSSVSNKLIYADPGTPWPPPDPDRMPRHRYKIADRGPFTYGAHSSGPDVQGFRERQHQDYLRFANGRVLSLNGTPFIRGGDYSIQQGADHKRDNPGVVPGWRDSAGDQLQDFGVDEDAEGNEEDDIPLAELLKQRKSARERLDGD
ncbi:MAG: hypothetical protein Q9218_006718 [Villophora microphyllina]